LCTHRCRSIENSNTNLVLATRCGCIQRLRSLMAKQIQDHRHATVFDVVEATMSTDPRPEKHRVSIAIRRFLSRCRCTQFRERPAKGRDHPYRSNRVRFHQGWRSSLFWNWRQGTNSEYSAERDAHRLTPLIVSPFASTTNRKPVARGPCNPPSGACSSSSQMGRLAIGTLSLRRTNETILLLPRQPRRFSKKVFCGGKPTPEGPKKGSRPLYSSDDAVRASSPTTAASCAFRPVDRHSAWGQRRRTTRDCSRLFSTD